VDSRDEAFRQLLKTMMHVGADFRLILFEFTRQRFLVSVGENFVSYGKEQVVFLPDMRRIELNESV
jgi:hypothetical protein